MITGLWHIVVYAADGRPENFSQNSLFLTTVGKMSDFLPQYSEPELFLLGLWPIFFNTFLTPGCKRCVMQQ